MRIVLSMWFLGLLLVVIAGALMTVATLQLSRVNAGHYLPLFIGRFAVRSPWKSTALRVGAQALAAAGAWIVALTTWNLTTTALILPAVALILPIAIPIIAITLQHNRRLETPSI